jgi:hypothetical protein
VYCLACDRLEFFCCSATAVTGDKHQHFVTLHGRECSPTNISSRHAHRSNSSPPDHGAVLKQCTYSAASAATVVDQYHSLLVKHQWLRDVQRYMTYPPEKRAASTIKIRI